VKLELFIDSADLDEVRTAADLGFVEGITTTPTFMIRLGIDDIDGTIAHLSHLTNQLHIEALGDTADEVVAEADRLASLPGLANPPVFKIPVTM
jgi:transaldolase